MCADHGNPACLQWSRLWFGTRQLAIPLFAALAFLCQLALANAQPVSASPVQPMLIIAPAAPGGGWDQTARAMAAVLGDLPDAPKPEVQNIPGAGGVVALSRFATGFKGHSRTLMISGLVMVGAIEVHRAPYGLDRVTPLARLTGEYEVVVVKAGSGITSLKDLLDRLKADAVSVDIGGGSTGGTDHILAGLLAQAIAVNPRRLSYVPFSGGGETVEGLISGVIEVGIGGLGEFRRAIEDGRLRAIGISSANPVPGVAIATLREQGVDVELMNWRAVMAPPDLPPNVRQELELLIERMAASPAWKRQLERNGWSDLYLSGPEFAQFLKADQLRVGALMRQLGLVE